MLTEPVPSPVMLAPLPDDTVSVPTPAGRLSVVVSAVVSTSATESPVIATLLSSVVVAVAGRVLTGASFVPLSVMVTSLLSLPPLLSLTVIRKIAVTVSPTARKSRSPSEIA